MFPGVLQLKCIECQPKSGVLYSPLPVAVGVHQILSHCSALAQDGELSLADGLKEQESCLFTQNTKVTDLRDEDHKAEACGVRPRPQALLGLGMKHCVAEQTELRRYKI